MQFSNRSLTLKRPSITNEMTFAAAKVIAARIGQDGRIDAEKISRCYVHPADGEKLASELELRFGLNLSVKIVAELNNMSLEVENLRREAESRWAKENGMPLSLPIGTQIASGVIAGVSAFSGATYLVKENGCKQKGRFLMVRFEDAVELSEDIEHEPSHSR